MAQENKPQISSFGGMDLFIDFGLGRHLSWLVAAKMFASVCIVTTMLEKYFSAFV
jgi:hypothetical protein